MPSKTNYGNLIKQYVTYGLSFVGASYLLFSFVIPFLTDNYKPLHRRITELYNYQIDPYNLIASIFFGLLGVYIAYQANLIAQRTLEQNRPVLVIDEKQTKTSDKNGGSSILTILNEGNFEASEIDVFIEKNESEGLIKVNNKFEFLAPKTKLSYTFDGVKNKSLLIKYKNPLTNKIYLYGSVIKFNVEIGESKFESFNENSLITNERYNKILRDVLTKNIFSL